MDIILKLLKTDLGINHSVRDEFFTAVIKANKIELEQKGCFIDTSSIDDQMLLSDYSAWNYRKRTEDIELSRNLQLRIRNKQLKSRIERFEDV